MNAAERAYGELLLSLSRGESVSFEAYCEARPALAEALREVAFEWGELFDPEDSAISPESLAEGLLGRFGSGATGKSGSETGADEAFVPQRPDDPRYEIGEEIGRGGMGAVFAAEDRNLDRRVAMKVLLGRSGGEGAPVSVSPLRLRRFLEEARVTGELVHPGIVPVHELGLDQAGRLFFTMREVRGRDLGRVFALARRGEQGWTRRGALEVLLKVCEVVALAHSRGVTHRDLKPANVLVGDYGEVYCLDWGLARRERAGGAAPGEEPRETERPWSGSPERTLDGTVIGTPSYMSPEQALGRPEETGPHSDVYGLGALLYHLLTGVPPFLEKGSATPPREVLDAVLFGELEPIERRAPGTPPELIAICEKAMTRDPQARYPGAAELALELRAYLEGRVVRAFESGAWAELRKWIGRHRGFSAAALVALLVVFACLTGITLLTERGTRDLTLLLDADLHDHLERRQDHLWPAHPDRQAGFLRWRASALRLAARREDHQARLDQWESDLTPEELEAVASIEDGEESLTLALTMTGERQETVWRYLSQKALVADLDDFCAPGGWLSKIEVQCRRIERMKRERDEPSPLWLEVKERVASSPWYDGLELRPQLGLVPLDPDPETGLWEFGHWPSGEVPTRGPDGGLEVHAGSSLVFVLLPGGMAQQGAFSLLDPWARPEEAPMEWVPLDPFFISKYEVTRGQLRRLSGEPPAPSSAETDSFPAVVDLPRSLHVTRLHLIEIPTEARWEYAVRAGTTSPWYTGSCREEVGGCANLGGVNVFDPYEGLAPIGSFPPNPFGLHETYGNLAEWCLEGLGSYVVPAESGNGFRHMYSGSRPVRGGNYLLGAEDARSARRMDYSYVDELTGLRPVRSIDPRAWFLDQPEGVQ